MENQNNAGQNVVGEKLHTNHARFCVNHCDKAMKQAGVYGSDVIAILDIDGSDKKGQLGYYKIVDGQMTRVGKTNLKWSETIKMLDDYYGAYKGEFYGQLNKDKMREYVAGSYSADGIGQNANNDVVIELEHLQPEDFKPRESFDKSCNRYKVSLAFPEDPDGEINVAAYIFASNSYKRIKEDFGEHTVESIKRNHTFYDDCIFKGEILRKIPSALPSSSKSSQRDTVLTDLSSHIIWREDDERRQEGAIRLVVGQSSSSLTYPLLSDSDKRIGVDGTLKQVNDFLDFYKRFEKGFDEFLNEEEIKSLLLPDHFSKGLKFDNYYDGENLRLYCDSEKFKTEFGFGYAEFKEEFRRYYKSGSSKDEIEMKVGGLPEPDNSFDISVVMGGGFDGPAKLCVKYEGEKVMEYPVTQKQALKLIQAYKTLEMEGDLKIPKSDEERMEMMLQCIKKLPHMVGPDARDERMQARYSGIYSCSERAERQFDQVCESQEKSLKEEFEEKREKCEQLRPQAQMIADEMREKYEGSSPKKPSFLERIFNRKSVEQYEKRKEAFELSVLSEQAHRFEEAGITRALQDTDKIAAALGGFPSRRENAIDSIKGKSLNFANELKRREAERIRKVEQAISHSPLGRLQSELEKKTRQHTQGRSR